MLKARFNKTNALFYIAVQWHIFLQSEATKLSIVNNYKFYWRWAELNQNRKITGLVFSGLVRFFFLYIYRKKLNFSVVPCKN